MNWGNVHYAMDRSNNFRRLLGKTVVRAPSTAVLVSICPKILSTLSQAAKPRSGVSRKVCVFLAFDSSVRACCQGQVA